MSGRRSLGVCFLVVAARAVPACGHPTAPDALDSPGSPDAAAPSPAARTMAQGALTLRESAGGWTATHRAQGFSTRVDAEGAKLAALDGRWTLGLHVTRVGRRGALRRATSAGLAERAGTIRLDRGDGVHEWFVHDARGLEQGVELEARPSGEGGLVVDVATEGLTPVLARDGASVELRDGAARTALRYTALAARDADGRALPASLAVEHGEIELRVADAGARYPIEIDPLVLGKTIAEFTSADSVANDGFGVSIAQSGATMVVGAQETTLNFHAQQGVAYVFTRAGGTWTQQGPALQASDGATEDYFGTSVAISGTTAIVGADGKKVGENLVQGAAYVFTLVGGTWTQQGPALAPSDPAAGDGFGHCVALSGTTAVVGAWTKTVGTAGAQGAAYVFTQTSAGWVQQGPALHASDGGVEDRFGSSVALAGSTLIVGAASAKIGASFNQGAAYVFTSSGGSWTQVGPALHAGDGTAGDGFATSVALSGTTALVGAPGKSIGANLNQGAVYVFAPSGGAWTQQGAPLHAGDPASYDSFGQSLALEGTTAIIGAYEKTVDKETTRGAVYAFTSSGGVWTQQGSPFRTADGGTGDFLGKGVTLDGGTVLASAWGKHAIYEFGLGSANADACSSAADCASGFCVEGVCCDSACTGSCRSCLGSRTGGVSGRCGDIPTLAACSACAVDADCPSGDFCAAGACAPKLANGAACSTTTPCASGWCVEGVCCNAVCGPCLSCLAARKGTGADGTCGAIPAGAADPECAGGVCTASGASALRCDGAGACVQTSPATSCGAFGCDAAGKACNVACKADSDCAGANHCASGSCVAPEPLGAACTASTQCASGFCADGVCCNVACTDTCQACSATRKAAHDADGRCGDALADPRCAANVTACAKGVCKASCAADADCASGFACVGGACVAKGPHCSPDRSASIDPAGVSTPCSAALCEVSSGVCGHACQSDADCPSGLACDAAKTCTAPTAAPAPSPGSSGGCAVDPGAGREAETDARVLGLGGLGGLGVLLAWRRRRKEA